MSPFAFILQLTPSRLNSTAETTASPSEEKLAGQKQLLICDARPISAQRARERTRRAADERCGGCGEGAGEMERRTRGWNEMTILPDCALNGDGNVEKCFKLVERRE